MVEPKLAEAKQQLGMLATMAPMFAAGAIEEAGNPEEAATMIAGVSTKLAAIDIGNPDKAKAAIAIVCNAARSLETKTVDEIASLELDAILSKGDLVFDAFVRLLDVYGLEIDEVLDSVRIETASSTDSSAELHVSMSVFGLEVDAFPVLMKRVDGRWMPERTESEKAVDLPETRGR